VEVVAVEQVVLILIQKHSLVLLLVILAVLVVAEVV
jgi:hypothetical protein